MSLRQSILHCVSAMLQINCIQILPITAHLVRDEESCGIFWSLSVLSCKPAVEILQNVLHTVLSKQGTEALLVYYNSMNDTISVHSFGLFDG